MTVAESPFRVLFVCTGNICRSPQAERLLVAELARRGLGDATEVSSAGVAALVGNPMDPQAAAHTIGHGGNPGDHSARQVDASMIDAADLVLTMERTHRAAVVRMVPRASRYAFTLPEFVRLAVDLRDSGEAGQVGKSFGVPERMRWLVPEVAAQRGVSLPTAPEHDEVEDPYRRSEETYRRSAARVAAAVSALVEVIVDLGEIYR
ncbi:low molecular weight phosphatase family protein [Protaetiibacter sp. SSC-01]|uniref:arsenate reductase/protein-tyrosine-phosphatase family protein n=1 Tax=Protaetiibacter sp. SSC-01 TaxID=2759943 RepID=UPI001657313F|nr:low molecular weight phosphatase family protein [Protaetiibacter sp. SSC-01]QNO38089.1 low molecular weight phosphatase family protein [Protaetiibacter sp. SSC-01]